ncbi:MAG TPA: glycosyltransferase [Solirubrobacteraceae bacterium]|nr:glycosyltransferase [Solirubrobacteraceae bacterium]
MRVCFLTPSLPAADAIERYARRLGAVVDQAPPDGEFDVAVATDWTTTARLFEVRARRHAFWVDHFAHRRMGTWQAERFAAQLAYDLPVDFLAAAPWVQRTLAELRPEARCELVTSGAPQAPAGEAARSAAAAPLRVHLAGDGDEGAAFEAMEEPSESVALADADVVVMLSAVDGVLGAPLAGFAAGATAVVGPAHDAEDLVRHEENGFVADADDPRGAARFLDRLARDRELLRRMRDNARATAAGWPTWQQAEEAMEAALGRLLAEDPPPQSRWPVRLMGDAIGGAAVFGREHATLTAEVHRLQAPPPPLARRALAAVKRRAKARLNG